MSISRWARAAVVACVAGIASAAMAQPADVAPAAGVAAVLQSLEKAVASGSPDAYLQLLSSSADRAAAAKFADENLAGAPRRATLRERERRPLEGVPPGDGYRLTVEILVESGSGGRLVTWQIDVRRAPPPGSRWAIENQRQLSTFENLYRLSLDDRREFAARDLVITAEDLRITLASGSVFVVDTDQGITGMVLLGKGEAVFSPAPASERGQIRIFAGSDSLRARFDACFVRTNPGDLARHLEKMPSARPVQPGHLRHARQLFADDVGRSFTFDLGDLSPGPWSILPPAGGFLAEIHTRHDGTLTYARSPHEPEAIALFDRAHRHYLARYSSQEQLRARGPFYSDDDRADYTVQHYDVEATFRPDRQWIDGRTEMTLQIRADAVRTIEVRLADSLAVRAVAGSGFGRLLAVRVRDQNAVMVTFPDALLRGAIVTLTVAYAGVLPPQSTTGPEAVVGAERAPALSPFVRIAPSYLYSARAAWYAQSPVSSYATATLRITVPQPYSCVASGMLVSSAPVADGPTSRQFVFDTPRPLPYLACLISELVHGDDRQVRLSDLVPARPTPVATPAEPVVRGADEAALATRSPSVTSPMLAVNLTVEGNPGERARARAVAGEAVDVLRFYTSLVGGCPYPDLTVAVIDNALPGGQSPAYLAVLNEQVAMSGLVWRDDPVSFPAFPEFFAAHEIAHQWWGEAVGGKNYHETWLSEALAQYFAALYAEHAHGYEVFAGMMRQMQRWARRDSAAGPVYLGQRVGQLANDARAFRAVVYDKGAIVFHMLRRLLGDDAFFRGLRLFYERWQFKKAGSDDLRKAFESASGRSLERFFDRWIYSDTLPRLGFSWRVIRGEGGDELDLRVEQIGDVFDLPLTVSIAYADRTTVDVVVPVADRVVERRVPLTGEVRHVTANADELVPATIRTGRQ